MPWLVPQSLGTAGIEFIFQRKKGLLVLVGEWYEVVRSCIQGGLVLRVRGWEECGAVTTNEGSYAWMDLKASAMKSAALCLNVFK